MTARGVDFTGIAYLVAIAIVGVVAWQLWANRNAIGAAVNPANPANLVNRGSDAIVKSATGGAARGGEDSLGGLAARFREWVTGTDRAIEAMKKGGTPAPASSPTWEEQLSAAGGVSL